MHAVFLRKVFVRNVKIIRKIIELDHNSNIRYISNHKFTKHMVLMKCCVEKEYEKVLAAQEDLLEVLAASHDEVHKYLCQALACLSNNHPAAAAANIGRCLAILESSRDEANAALENEDDDE